MPRKPASLSEQALKILMHEYDSLRDLYNQNEQRVQGLFNYYLTLMTAIFGAVLLISQIVPATGTDLLLQKLALGVLLIFFATIGSLHLSSLSTASAHSVRYAQGMNEIRQVLFSQLGEALPPIYKAFMAKPAIPGAGQNKGRFILSLIIPVSPYQLFVTVVNSLTWALVILYVFMSTPNPPMAVLTRSAVGFVVLYLIYSIYARVAYELTLSRLNIRIGN